MPIAQSVESTTKVFYFCRFFFWTWVHAACLSFKGHLIACLYCCLSLVCPPELLTLFGREKSDPVGQVIFLACWSCKRYECISWKSLLAYRPRSCHFATTLKIPSRLGNRLALKNGGWLCWERGALPRLSMSWVWLALWRCCNRQK